MNWNMLNFKDNKYDFIDFTYGFLLYFQPGPASGKNKDDIRKEIDSIKHNLESARMATISGDMEFKYEEKAQKILPLKHLLRIEKMRKLTDKEIATKDNCSLVFELLAYVLYDEIEQTKKNDYDHIMEFLDFLYFQNQYWYGFMKNDDAMDLVSCKSLGSTSECWYMIYAPIEDRGKWKMLMKFNKKSVLNLAFNHSSTKIIDPKRNRVIVDPDAIFDCSQFFLSQLDTVLKEKIKVFEKKYKISFMKNQKILQNPGSTITVFTIPTSYKTANAMKDDKDKTIFPTSLLKNPDEDEKK